MSILLTNQYLDTLNNFADKQGNNTIFLPANPDGVESIRTQILSALKAKQKLSEYSEIFNFRLLSCSY